MIVLGVKCEILCNNCCQNIPPQHSSQQNNLEQQRQQLAQRRREIEERTLASSERGLGLLHESEKVCKSWFGVMCQIVY